MGGKLFYEGRAGVKIEGDTGRVFVDGQGPIGRVGRSELWTSKWEAFDNDGERMNARDPKDMFGSRTAAARWMARRYLAEREGVA